MAGASSGTTVPGAMTDSKMPTRLPRDVDNAIIALEWEIKRKRKRIHEMEAKTELSENDKIKIGQELEFTGNVTKLIKSFKAIFDANFGKIAPNDVELEMQILGALMLGSPPSVTPYIDRIKKFLSPDHFYMDTHATIYRAILQLYESGAPVDMGSVKNHLRKRGWLDQIGGPHYIALCTTKVDAPDTIEYNSRILLEFAMRRHLILVCADSLRNLYDDSCEVFDEIDKHETAIKNCKSWMK